MKQKPRYSYNKHGGCRYYGKCLLKVDTIVSNSIYEINESYLARNEEGVLGFIGQGPKWFLNYVAGEGSWAFNPIKEEDIVWSPYHNAYVYAIHTDHFRWPIIVNERYKIEDGEKYVTWLYTKRIDKLPEFEFMKKSKYF